MGGGEGCKGAEPSSYAQISDCWKLILHITSPLALQTCDFSHRSFSLDNGTISLNQTIFVSKLYTYSCPGTGGHTEYIKIWNTTTGWNVTATWNGYTGDWHNISFNTTFTLYANETYNYTIRTGSYPQIIHTDSKDVIGGTITCEEFIDINGNQHEGWIPAIWLF